ncbi:hypothetical protein [Streptomyces sp. NPDC056661]|uniref:hypothetical protein n=1 Tax=Streptomyces sp. NPDC056661 TaxID=3345898 RepID=UPI003683B69C
MRSMQGSVIEKPSPITEGIEGRDQNFDTSLTNYGAVASMQNSREISQSVDAASKRSAKTVPLHDG